jgi:L-malate glycosyltransferase
MVMRGRHLAERSAIAIIWTKFGPYHLDRCEALAARLEDHAQLHGIEIASRSDVYAWQESGPGRRFQKHTLFPGQRFEATSAPRRFARLLRICRRLRVRHILVSNYNHPDLFLLALVMRLFGSRGYIMLTSKFDDKPRRWWREALKTVLFLPYRGALAAGPRAEGYLRFLGFRGPIVTGHNTVDLEAVLHAGGGLAAPAGLSFRDRHFVLVGRFVPKKNIDNAVAAYARYRDLAGTAARELHICGSGPLEAEIREQIAGLEVDGITLHGFLQREGVARVLSGGLALLIPSVDEQWGLVVNEALAFSLPILASDQVGARDLLIRTGVNGYIFEPGNSEGLAHLMHRIGHDEAEWRRLIEGSRQLRAKADVARFAEAVLALLKA